MAEDLPPSLNKKTNYFAIILNIGKSILEKVSRER
jgi:hypothetical protein